MINAANLTSRGQALVLLSVGILLAALPIAWAQQSLVDQGASYSRSQIAGQQMRASQGPPIDYRFQASPLDRRNMYWLNDSRSYEITKEGEFRAWDVEPAYRPPTNTWTRHGGMGLSRTF